MREVEVLAPAGSLDICKAVIRAGADAVYLGGDMFGQGHMLAILTWKRCLRRLILRI